MEGEGRWKRRCGQGPGAGLVGAVADQAGRRDRVRGLKGKHRQTDSGHMAMHGQLASRPFSTTSISYCNI